MDLHEVSIILDRIEKKLQEKEQDIKRLEAKVRRLEDDLGNHQRSQYANSQ